MKHIPWKEIRKRYESEKISSKELAREYGISDKSVRIHAKEEGWIRGERVRGTAEACVSSAVRQLAKRLESAENGEEMNLGEIKELTAVLKELVKVKESLEHGGETEAVVRVEMSEEVEAWSK